MRLRAQTAKIEGHFALFPEKAHWLDAYLLELTTFPNAKHDDQVDSTVNALAWSTQEATKPGMGIRSYYKREAERLGYGQEQNTKMRRVKVPRRGSYYLITGRKVAIPPDCIIEVTDGELIPILQNGGVRVD